MAQLIVGLESEVARRLHRGDRRPARAVLAALKTAGDGLQPLHPDTDDADLQPWFWVEVDDDHAAALAERLRDLPAVTSAYVKPMDSPP